MISHLFSVELDRNYYPDLQSLVCGLDVFLHFPAFVRVKCRCDTIYLSLLIFSLYVKFLLSQQLSIYCIVVRVN